MLDLKVSLNILLCSKPQVFWFLWILVWESLLLMHWRLWIMEMPTALEQRTCVWTQFSLHPLYQDKTSDCTRLTEDLLTKFKFFLNIKLWTSLFIQKVSGVFPMRQWPCASSKGGHTSSTLYLLVFKVPGIHPPGLCSPITRHFEQRKSCEACMLTVIPFLITWPESRWILKSWTCPH